MAEPEELERKRDTLLLDAGVLDRRRAGGLAGEGVAPEERGTPVSSESHVARSPASVDEQAHPYLDDEPTYPPETDDLVNVADRPAADPPPHSVEAGRRPLAARTVR